MPSLSTFCVTPDQIAVALSSGVTHIILEDPEVSVRSFCFEQGSFLRLKMLVDQVRRQDQKCSLSLNVDLLSHQAQLALVARYLMYARDLGITTIRIQDPGLALFIREKHPDFQCHLSMETGNANRVGLGVHSRYVQQQCFALDMAFSDMMQAPPGLYELMVQGPILIQYSQRRFLQNVADLTEAGGTFLARDTEYSGRLYRFYDNPHGHFMYLYFHRCLLSCLDLVRQLPVVSWLIDARGESLEYLAAALRYYSLAAQMLPVPEDAISTLSTLSNSPQRPGFFRANLTDQDRKIDLGLAPLAVIMDVLKEDRVTCQVVHSFSASEILKIVTPEGKTFLFSPNWYSGLDGMRQSYKGADAVFHKGDFVIFQWQKGVSANSCLCKEV